MRKLILATLVVALGVAVQGFAESPKSNLVAAIPSSGAIMGKGQLNKVQLADVLLAENPALDKGFAQDFSQMYITEAAAEGVNHDIAFSQMCVETNFFKFNGLVTRDSNNFGGIGVIDEQNRGVRFPSALLGVRAQIQHLKGYATEEPLAQARVDPRYYNIFHGSAPSIADLSGRWSVNVAYAENLRNVTGENGKKLAQR
ncbi:lipoprotein [Spirochaetia bacterium]|nr:lipoprotein [Spirochaetia bacterium]